MVYVLISGKCNNFILTLFMKSLSPLLLLVTASFFTILEYFFLGIGFYLFPSIHPLNAYFWGLVGSGVISGLYLVFSKKHKSLVVTKFSQYWTWGFGLSCMVITMGMCWFFAMANAPAGIMAFLENITIPVTFIIGIIFFKDRFSSLQMFSLILAGIGFFLFSNLKGEVNLLPIIAILTMAFIFSIQSFLVKKYMQNFDFLTFTYIRNFITIALGVLVFSILGYVEMIPFAAIIYFSIATLCGFFLARIFYFEAHKHVSIGAIHFFGLIEPICVMILSILFLGEGFSIKKLLAASIVLLGLFLFFKTEEFLQKKEGE